MSSHVSVARGAEALRRLLDEQCLDVRQLDLPAFRHWLNRQLDRWQDDSVFAQRTKIRSLRRSDPRLLTLEQAHRRAAAADATAASHDRLQQLSREMADADKAIAGLAQAVEGSVPEKRAALQQKLESFLARRQSLQVELAELVRVSPERQALMRIEDELQQLRRTTGVDREEAMLAKLQRERGQRSGRSGESFEQLTTRLVTSEIVPELLRGGKHEAEGKVHVLGGVTLGAARVELDQLVIRQPPGEGEPVEVVAVVEAKRNINDLAHGFRRRQENLAWLTGNAGGYDAQEYRTRHFVSGHFDRPAIHQHEGKEFRFTRGSFRYFHRDASTQLFLDSLYLITRPGPLWGLSSAALSRIGYRVATDRRWDPDDEEYLHKLMRWCRTLSHDVETPDVLRIYASTAQRSRQVLLAVEHTPRNWPIVNPSEFGL